MIYGGTADEDVASLIMMEADETEFKKARTSKKTDKQEKKKQRKKKERAKRKKRGQPKEEEDVEENAQLKALQKDVDQIAEIMVSNVDKMLDRGEKIEELLENAEDLEAHAKDFSVVTRQVKEKYRWKNWKRTLCLSIIITSILLGIAGIIVLIIL